MNALRALLVCFRRCSQLSRRNRRRFQTSRFASPSASPPAALPIPPARVLAPKMTDALAIMTANGLVRKLWNYCNILRDDALPYGDYVEPLGRSTGSMSS